MRLNPTFLRPLFVTVATTTLLGACADDAPLGVEQTEAAALFAATATADLNKALATMRRVTAAYHDLEAAIADGFVLLHPCEERPGEGPVGTVYVHIGRLLDPAIDPALPEALIYEPRENGGPKLVGVEFAMLYGHWNEPDPPTFFGHSFQPEEEFGVYALHAWVWLDNPEGMFAEANPRVSCGA
jgi:hypothetical protein